jgi:hypothetical protein
VPIHTTQLPGSNFEHRSPVLEPELDKGRFALDDALVKRRLQHIEELRDQISILRGENIHLKEENHYLKEELEGTSKLLSRYIRLAQKHGWEVTQEDLEQETKDQEVIDKLNAKGVPVYRIPYNVYPGMPYAIGHDLVSKGAAAFSDSYLSKAWREIGSVRLFRLVLHPMSAVAKLWEKEREAALDEKRMGRRPGKRWVDGAWVSYQEAADRRHAI